MSTRPAPEPKKLPFALHPRQIEAFRAVLLTGNMTSAAEHLYVTQPAVSRLIRDLEHALRMELFQRNGAHLLPTPEALLLHREVERSFIGLERIARAADEIRRLQSGSLRLAATPALSSHYLAGVIREFRDRHPGVAISVQSAHRLGLCEMVASRQVDIGLGAPPREHPGIEWEALPLLEAVCVVPPDHPFVKKSVVRPADFKDQPLILRSGSQMQARVEAALAALGIPYRPSIECSEAPTICSLVAQGVGIAVVDPFTANEFQSRGIVCRRLRPAVPYDTALAFAAQRPRPQLAVEFGRLLASAIGRDFSDKRGKRA
jgi:DNA-binding transcriptional LysR family regulator